MQRVALQLPDLPFPGRGAIANGLPRLNGKTLLAGGEVYDPGPDSRLFYNSVFTYDDTRWRRIKANASFPALGYHNLVALGSRYFVLKGYPTENSKRIHSADSTGACFRPERAVAGSADHAASAASALDGGYIIITGSTTSPAVTRIRAP